MSEDRGIKPMKIFGLDFILELPTTGISVEVSGPKAFVERLFPLNTPEEKTSKDNGDGLGPIEKSDLPKPP